MDGVAATLYVVKPLAPERAGAIGVPRDPRVIVVGEGSRAGALSQAPLEPLPRSIPLVRFDPILPPAPLLTERDMIARAPRYVHRLSR